MYKRCNLITRISFVFCIIHVTILIALPTGWRPIIMLDRCSDVEHFDPRISTSSCSIHVIYTNNACDPSRCHEVTYNRSTNTGVSWSDGSNIEVNSNSISDSLYANDIAAYGNIIHAVYEFEVNPARDDIRYAQSTNGGSSWSDTIWISQASDKSVQPRISIFDNDTIFVVFSDYRHGSGGCPIGC
jgi:hypothetical protein